MSLEWNFIGSAVVDWQTSYQFYNQVLGFATHLNPAHGDWALIGGGWDDYYADEKDSGVVFELFDDGRPASTDRTWGHGQGIRPALHVQNIDESIAYLKSRGIIFTSEIETQQWGKRIEFLAPESIRLALLETPDRTVTKDWERPIIGSVEIKAHDFLGQVAFYRDVMGLEVAAEYETGVILRHSEKIGADKPQIRIEKGGEKVSNDPQWAHDPVRGHPFFLSFMTKEIEAVNETLKSHNVTILKELQSHSSWGGTDIHIADADGNGIQVVQYH